MYARRWRETIWESTSVSSSPSKGTYHKRCEEWKTTEMASSHLENLYDERTWWNYNSLHCLKSASYENLTQVNTSLPSSSCQLLPKNWLCYNRERVSELFTAHEDSPQESESYGQLLGDCTIVYSSRFVRRLHKIFVICSKQCGTELNWQKHIFRLLIPKYHLREMNEKYHLREMNKNSATENYYDNIQY